MPRTISLVAESQVRQILAQLRQHVLIGFPNPRRDGCPDHATLRAMAFRVKTLQLSSHLVSHVASCSPCFRDYSSLRKSVKHQRIAKIMVGIAASLLIAAGIFVFRPRPNLPSPPPIAQTPVPAPTPVATVVVNLASLVRTRGQGTANTDQVTLPAKRLRVKFLMPIGSEPGRYDVQIIRSGGESVIDTVATAGINDGVTSFEVEVSLETLKSSALTLLVRPPGLIWQRYPIYVE
jgi:hypothetical protein